MPSLFLPRSRPWLWATAAEGGLEPAPASRFRGVLPHRLNSYALLGLSAFRAHGALSPAILNFRGGNGSPNVRIADQPLRIRLKEIWESSTSGNRLLEEETVSLELYRRTT
jgi:hypothetical protein